jgi:RNA polymerase sigma-70 factor (ECF subfamily)
MMMPSITDDAIIADDAVTADAARTGDSPTKQSKMARERDAIRLRKAQSLDRNTLGGIYDEYHQPLYSYIYRRVGDVETARDLTADVFRRFLQATANGNGPNEHLRAWLYRVAHNIVIDHYRRQQHQPSAPLEEKWASVDDDPGKAAELEMQCEYVRAALRHLTADQQQIIVLKFLEGLTNHEIAEVTQKSVGSVKSLQHRALAALRRHLVPSEEEVPQ